jgi:hypothetical protein
METKPIKIFTQIPLVMGDVGAIGKSGVNRDQNYKFRSIDDVYNKLQPALQKNGVFFIPQVIESKEEHGQTKSGSKNVRVKLRVKYTIYADDGSSIEAIVEGEGIDTSDKATNKALTAAFKYMLIQIFCIAVEGSVDADNEFPELQFVKENKKPSPGPTKPADLTIANGKYKGKKVSAIPKEELKEYVQQIESASADAGKACPKWFLEMKKAAGL